MYSFNLIPAIAGSFYFTYSLFMKHIDHIGIAVKNLETSIVLFEKLLNTACYKIEDVVSEHVKTAFISTGQTKIELLAGTIEDGTIDKFIKQKGEKIHHIAFEVEDIYAEMQRLSAEGFILLDEKPRNGADNKLVCFLHPKSTNGVLIELCQEIKDSGDHSSI